MESEYNQICEYPLLDELEMLSASSRDGHSGGDVETRAGQKIWASGKFHENIKILSKTTANQEYPRRARKQQLWYLTSTLNVCPKGEPVNHLLGTLRKFGIMRKKRYILAQKKRRRAWNNKAKRNTQATAFAATASYWPSSLSLSLYWQAGICCPVAKMQRRRKERL